MSNQGTKRLLKEFERIQKDPPEGCAVSPDENNIFKWTGILFGPEDTIWEEANFKFKIEYPENYPQSAPKIFFTPPIYHPNVHMDENNYGRVSMDIIKTNWSPVLDTWAILISLRSLLTDPNPQVFANKEAHEMYFKQKQQYNEKIKKFIEEYELEDDDLEEDEDQEGNNGNQEGDQQQNNENNIPQE